MWWTSQINTKVFRELFSAQHKMFTMKKALVKVNWNPKAHTLMWEIETHSLNWATLIPTNKSTQINRFLKRLPCQGDFWLFNLLALKVKQKNFSSVSHRVKKLSHLWNAVLTTLLHSKETLESPKYVQLPIEFELLFKNNIAKNPKLFSHPHGKTCEKIE